MSELIIIKYLPSNLTPDELGAVLGRSAFHCFGLQQFKRNYDKRRYAFVRILSHLSQDDVVAKLSFLDALGQSAYVDRRKFTYTGWISEATERDSVGKNDEKIYRNAYFRIVADNFDQSLEVVDFRIKALGVYGLEVGHLVAFNTYVNDSDPSENANGAAESAVDLEIADMTNLFCGSIVEKGADWLIAFDAVCSISKIASAYGVTEGAAPVDDEVQLDRKGCLGSTAMALLSRSQKARLIDCGATAGDAIWVPIFASEVVCQVGDFAFHNGKVISLRENVSLPGRSGIDRPASRPVDQIRRGKRDCNPERLDRDDTVHASRNRQEVNTQSGAIKFIDWKKKFGYIVADEGVDVFITPPMVKKLVGLKIEVGDRVSYRIYSSDKDGRPCAKEIQLLK